MRIQAKKMFYKSKFGLEFSSRMIKKTEREQKQDMEERYKFVNMDDFKEKNWHAFNHVDTLEYQLRTSTENMSHLKRSSMKPKPKIHFEIPQKGLASKEDVPTTSKNNHGDSKLVLVDLFQRLREKPKVTREMPTNQYSMTFNFP